MAVQRPARKAMTGPVNLCQGATAEPQEKPSLLTTGPRPPGINAVASNEALTETMPAKLSVREKARHENGIYSNEKRGT